MTTDVLEGQMSFDALISERDAIHRERRDSAAAERVIDDDYDTFVGALRAATQPSMVISQNDVRVLLFEETVDGPRCRIQHNRYSGLFSRACKDGWIERVRDGHDWVRDICTTSPTGNNGKAQFVYRWIGRAA